jgi:hypothetical protein
MEEVSTWKHQQQKTQHIWCFNINYFLLTSASQQLTHTHKATFINKNRMLKLLILTLCGVIFIGTWCLIITSVVWVGVDWVGMTNICWLKISECFFCYCRWCLIDKVERFSSLLIRGSEVSLQGMTISVLWDDDFNRSCQ